MTEILKTMSATPAVQVTEASVGFRCIFLIRFCVGESYAASTCVDGCLLMGPLHCSEVLSLNRDSSRASCEHPIV